MEPQKRKAMAILRRWLRRTPWFSRTDPITFGRPTPPFFVDTESGVVFSAHVLRDHIEHTGDIRNPVSQRCWSSSELSRLVLLTPRRGPLRVPTARCHSVTYAEEYEFNSCMERFWLSTGAEGTSIDDTLTAEISRRSLLNRAGDCLVNIVVDHGPERAENNRTRTRDNFLERAKAAQDYGSPRWHLRRLLILTGFIRISLHVRQNTTSTPPSPAAVMRFGSLRTGPSPPEVSRTLGPECENKSPDSAACSTPPEDGSRPCGDDNVV